MCVTICGRFCSDEGVVAGYDNRIRAKYTAKWGVQIAGMIFQTRFSVKKQLTYFYRLTAQIGIFLQQTSLIFYYLRTAPHTSEIIPTTTTSGRAIATNPPIASAIKTNGRNTSVNNTFVIPHVILTASPINFPKTPIIRQTNTNVSISFTLFLKHTQLSFSYHAENFYIPLYI